MISSAANVATLLSAGSSSVQMTGMASADLAATGSQKGGMSVEQADKVSKDFESMFVGQMLEQMFGDSLGSSAFGDSETSDVYKGMMMDAYGKEIAKSGGIGIADYVKRELLKQQEIAG